MYFGSPRLGHTIKTNSIKFHTVDPDLVNFDFLENGVGIVSPTHFFMLSVKNISHVIFY